MSRIAGLLLACCVAAVGLSACSDDKGTKSENKKRDAVISKNCEITATVPTDSGVETGFRSTVAKTNNPEQDKVIDDFTEYWRRYFLAIQSRDVKGSCVKVYISTSQQNVDNFVKDLQDKDERYVGYGVLTAVSNIDINGDEATLKACLDQSNSHRINDKDEPVESPAGEIGLEATMIQADGIWRIAEQRASETCAAKAG